MSDTPRTDAETGSGPDRYVHVHADFARTLERELTAALARREGVERRHRHTLDSLSKVSEHLGKVQAERDEARAELTRLTTPQPACDHDNETLVIAFLSDRTQQRLARHLEPWEWWTPIPTPKEPTP